ncbi:MAG: hypothetical protein RLP44_18140 [Aggregatilineales bacterium]
MLCWRALIDNGELSLEEARDMLEAWESVTDVRIEDEDYLLWSFAIEDRTYYGSLYRWGIFTVSSGENFSVADLVEEIGEPSEVYVTRAWSSEVNCAGAFLFYLEEGIRAFITPQDEFVGVSEDQRVRIELLTREVARNHYMTDTVNVEWRGYMDYCEFMPDLTGRSSQDQ